MKKIIVVTGGAGLIGQEFVKAVVEQGGIAIIADINKVSKLLFKKWLKEQKLASWWKVNMRVEPLQKAKNSIDPDSILQHFNMPDLFSDQPKKTTTICFNGTL